MRRQLVELLQRRAVVERVDHVRPRCRIERLDEFLKLVRVLTA
jgi:hypothetical protein